MGHYRCLSCYFPSTKSERPTNTVTFFPDTIPIPKLGLENFLRQSVSNAVTLLSDPPSTKILELQEGDETQNMVQQLAENLKQTTTLLKMKDNSYKQNLDNKKKIKQDC